MTRSDLSPRPHPRTLRSSIHNVPFFAHQGGLSGAARDRQHRARPVASNRPGQRGNLADPRRLDGFGRSGECLALHQPVVARSLAGRGACSNLPASAIKAASGRTWSH